MKWPHITGSRVSTNNLSRTAKTTSSSASASSSPPTNNMDSPTPAQLEEELDSDIASIRRERMFPIHPNRKERQLTGTSSRPQTAQNPPRVQPPLLLHPPIPPPPTILLPGSHPHLPRRRSLPTRPIRQRPHSHQPPPHRILRNRLPVSRPQPKHHHQQILPQPPRYPSRHLRAQRPLPQTPLHPPPPRPRQRRRETASPHPPPHHSTLHPPRPTRARLPRFLLHDPLRP